MKVIQMEYKGEIYTRQTNPPNDKDILIRWKRGNLRVYDKISEKYWWEWKFSGRWMNKLGWELCEEPEIEKEYQKRLHNEK